jgi:hypothetical protein
VWRGEDEERKKAKKKKHQKRRKKLTAQLRLLYKPMLFPELDAP